MAVAPGRAIIPYMRNVTRKSTPRNLLLLLFAVAALPATTLRPPGAGPFPAVVVSHGFSASGRLMDGIAIAFARDGWLVIVPDHAGHGANHDPLTDADLPGQVADVVDALRSRDDVSSVSLLGHSMGAGAATQAAAADPQLGRAAPAGVVQPGRLVDRRLRGPGHGPDPGGDLRFGDVPGRGRRERVHEHPAQHLLERGDADNGRLRGHITPDHLWPVDFLCNNDYWIWYYCGSDRHRHG